MCFLALRRYGMWWVDIGTIMHRDHSTCVYGAQTLMGRMETERDLAATYEWIYREARSIAEMTA